MYMICRQKHIKMYCLRFSIIDLSKTKTRYKILAWIVGIGYLVCWLVAALTGSPIPIIIGTAILILFPILILLTVFLIEKFPKWFKRKK